MKMSKFFYAGTLLIVFVAILIVGCVKLPSEAPPLPEFKASVRFMNTLIGGDPVAVSVDGSLKATLASGETSDYMEVNAGNRVITVDDVLDTNFIETDFKGTVFINEDGLIFNRERDTHTYTPLSDTTAFVVVAQMFSPSMEVTVTDSSGAEFDLGGVAGNIDKTELYSGPITIDLLYSWSVTVDTTITTYEIAETVTDEVIAQTKYTFVVTGSPDDDLSVAKLINE
ncbi:DUF4397 domain-containing protein [candidate division KSB1 bacterium]|nr:DUF4397 domain-containing protein [candidate division KSB1 bacterium]